MPNDGVFDSSTFAPGNFSEPAAPPPSAPAPGSTPAPNGGLAAHDGESQFGGNTPDIPFDEPAATQQPNADGDQQAQQQPQDDDFIGAETVSPEDLALLNEQIHGVKGIELLKALKGGGLPAEVLGALTNVSIPALEEQIHGVTASALLEAIKGNRLPPELREVLMETVTVGDQQFDVSHEEMRQGYMRARDHTKKNMIAAEQRAKAENTIARFNEMIETWQKNPDDARAGAKRFGFHDQLEKYFFQGFDKPDTLRQALTRRGFGPALYELADTIRNEGIALWEMGFYPDGKTPFPAGKAAAERMIQDRANREALDRDLWLKEIAIQDANDRARMQQQQRQRANQQRQPQQQTAEAQEITRLVGQAMPEALKRNGIEGQRVNEYVANVYHAEVAARIRGHEGNLDDRVLGHFCLEAARAAAEAVRDMQHGSPGTAPANGNGRAPLLAPRVLAPATQQPAAQTSPAAQQIAAAQQQRPATPNPSPLSPRAGAAPTAPTLPATFQQGGSSEDFAQHMAFLRGGGRRR